MQSVHAAARTAKRRPPSSDDPREAPADLLEAAPDLARSDRPTSQTNSAVPAIAVSRPDGGDLARRRVSGTPPSYNRRAMLPASFQIPAAIILVAGGLLSCFAGYRVFRVVLAFFGFVFGALFASSAMGSDQTLWMIGGGAARRPGRGAASCSPRTSSAWR